MSNHMGLWSTAVVLALIAAGPLAWADPEPSTNCQLSVPWYVDTAGAAQRLPANDMQITTIIFLHNNLSEDLAAAIEYYTQDGVFVGPEWPDNYFLIPKQSTVAFRPVADDPASVPGGQEAPVAQAVPNRPMGTEGGNDNKKNGSIVVRWQGNTTDVQGMLKEWRQVDGDSLYSNSVLLPPGSLFDYVPAPQMISLAGGTFQMGDVFGEGDPDELPVHTVTLSAYEIGKYEVTNQQVCHVFNWANGQGYFDTVDATTATAYGEELLDLNEAGCQISYTGGEFVSKERDGYSMADHPVVDISWYGAVVYCCWLSEMQGLTPAYNLSTWTPASGDGYHLPSEAQWEYAAAYDPAAPTDDHWRYGQSSDSIDCNSANYMYDTMGFYCNPLGLSSIPLTAPVGYHDGVNAGTMDSPSPAGCYDMSGNVREWCHDWYSETYYASSPGSNPAGPASGSYRVARGGGWHNSGSNCRSARRGYYDPSTTFNNIGFRLARY